MTTTELATVGEWLPGCEVAKEGNEKQVQFDIKQEDADHALKAWPTAESGNYSESAVCYTKPFKCALNDQVTGDAAGVGVSPLFFRENHSMSSWCIKPSQERRLKTAPMLLSAA